MVRPGIREISLLLDKIQTLDKLSRRDLQTSLEKIS